MIFNGTCAARANRRFEFRKRSQLFIAAMCVCNPDRSPVAVHG